MRRFRLILLSFLGLVVFLLISAVLTRVLTVDGDERSAIVTLLDAQARGDTAAMIRQIQGCHDSDACRQRVSENAASLARSGSVKILELNPSAGFSLGSTLGTARVAWAAGNSLPIVQCVRVRRAGDAFSGLHVELLEISRRIKSDAACPAKY